MPRKRHSEEKIIYALKRLEGGGKVPEVCRELGVKQLEEQNRRLKV